jgi:hypothetical protein
VGLGRDEPPGASYGLKAAIVTRVAFSPQFTTDHRPIPFPALHFDAISGDAGRSLDLYC